MAPTARPQPGPTRVEGPRPLPAVPVLLDRYAQFSTALGYGPQGPSATGWAQALTSARRFLRQHPDDQAFLCRPVAEQYRYLQSCGHYQQFFAFLVWEDHMRPSYELLATGRWRILFTAVRTFLGEQEKELSDALRAVGYRDDPGDRQRSSRYPASGFRALTQIYAHTGKRQPQSVTEDDLVTLYRALWQHAGGTGYHTANVRALAVGLWHLGIIEQKPRWNPDARSRTMQERFAHIRAPVVREVCIRYVDEISAHLVRSSVDDRTWCILRFAEFLQDRFPEVQSLADLRRQPHLTAWLREGAAYVPPYRPRLRPCSYGGWLHLVEAVRLFLERTALWEWPDAPSRPLLGTGDVPPTLPTEPRALDEADATRLLKAAVATKNLLGRVCTLMLLRTGMRLGELRLLQTDSFYRVRDPESGRLVWMVRVPAFKRHGERSIPLLSADVLEAKEAWDLHRPNIGPLPHPHGSRRDACFWLVGGKGYGIPGMRVGTEAIRRAIRDVAREAGLDPAAVWPHRLRHTLATQLINQPQVRQWTVSRILGHRPGSPQTARYAVMRDQTVLTEMRGLHQLLDAQLFGVDPDGPILEEPPAVRELRQQAQKAWRDQGYCYCSRDPDTFCISEESCLRCGLAVYRPEHLPVLERMAVSAEAAGQVRRLKLILAAVDRARARCQGPT